MQRRTLLAGIAAAALGPAASVAARSDPLEARLAAVENGVGGRLGVAMLDTGSGRFRGYRADERFRMCSTFKLLLAGFVLHQIDHGDERIDRRVRYAVSDLPDHSPISARHVADGMTIGALCEAAVTVSDNGAANVLLGQVGGPPALTRWLRATGDPSTRLDRTEPTLNDAPPGDPRDTSTPAAMIATMRRLLLVDTLSPDARARLSGWLVASTTGKARIRAAAPPGWTVGDKTGTWNGPTNGTSNDVAILWPPARPPILIAIYLVGSPAPGEARDAAIAQAAKHLLATV